MNSSRRVEARASVSARDVGADREHSKAGARLPEGHVTQRPNGLPSQRGCPGSVFPRRAASWQCCPPDCWPMWPLPADGHDPGDSGSRRRAPSRREHQPRPDIDVEPEQLLPRRKNADHLCGLPGPVWPLPRRPADSPSGCVTSLVTQCNSAAGALSFFSGEHFAFSPRHLERLQQARPWLAASRAAPARHSRSGSKCRRKSAQRFAKPGRPPARPTVRPLRGGSLESRGRRGSFPRSRSAVRLRGKGRGQSSQALVTAKSAPRLCRAPSARGSRRNHNGSTTGRAARGGSRSGEIVERLELSGACQSAIPGRWVASGNRRERGWSRRLTRATPRGVVSGDDGVSSPRPNRRARRREYPSAGDGDQAKQRAPHFVSPWAPVPDRATDDAWRDSAHAPA